MYVTPIYLCRREPKTKPEEALELLKKRCEVSNMIMVSVRCAGTPEFYQAESASGYVQYQLAVNRKFRIREDPADLKTDYPWVKAYGSQAISDAKCLQTGSVVYINGALQTREGQPYNGLPVLRPILYLEGRRYGNCPVQHGISCKTVLCPKKMKRK